MAKKAATPGTDMERFKQVKERVTQIIGDQRAVKEMNKSFADMYWIGETGAGAGISNSDRTPRYNRNSYDKNDVRLTASTSSRDRVTGIHRMMRTSKPKFKATCKSKTYANKIENFLDRIWEASCTRKRSRLESDLILSGILFTDENLEVVEVEDLIQMVQQGLAKKPGDGVLKTRLKRLQDLQAKSPVVFEVGSPMVTYPVWGEDGLSEYLVWTQIKGKKLRERWGVVEMNGGPVKDNDNYNLYDYRDLEIRCIHVDGQAEPIVMKPYNRPDMPCFSAIADGTGLFPEEERQRQPFLYGMWKSGLADREDEAWTTLMTGLMIRGLNQILIVDSSAPNYNANSVMLKYAGAIPYIEAPGGAQLMDNKALDPNFLQALNLLFQTGERTTVPTQTLGENIEPGVTYSGYAMASQNGRVVIIGIQEGTEKVVKDASMYVLKLVKDGTIVDTELKRTDILDDLELEVHMEVDLPQDALRKAQMIAQIRNSNVPVTNEWIHEQLQIKDSEKMTADWMTEQAIIELFKADLPRLIQEILAMMPQKQPPTPEGIPPGPTGEAVPPGMHQMEDGTMMADNEMQYPTTPGGPEAAMAGGQVMPATEPMNPEQARKGRA